jgi:predicted phosphodiesterase
MSQTRLLLVTDTHGHLDQINAIAGKTGADAVVHAGDFGFYDEDSTASLSDRELALRIVHSALKPELRKRAFDLSREEKIALIRERCPLSDIPLYLVGQKRFNVPVYAVWGNHEDKAVVEKFLRAEYYLSMRGTRGPLLPIAKFWRSRFKLVEYRPSMHDAHLP